ncbi:unnamed protein product [Prorocentrum cordatum]|uniref:BRO1 domain-containing protein n=1 Tax=Prorocentrum cordatum TaxID=2364126 RepID=A0ABN9VQL8_9DINO|nr:unnamed protein product [Polarella glacialis]
MAALGGQTLAAAAPAQPPSASGDPAREAFRALGRQASAGLEAAASGLRERVGTLMEGQRLLSSGAAAERALLAKGAAAEASAADAEALRVAPGALAAIEGAAQMLWYAAHLDELAPNSELRDLAEVYFERARAFRLSTDTLGGGALVAPELSAAEQDAIYLAQTRAALACGLDLACQTVKARSAEGAAAVDKASRGLADGCCAGAAHPAPRPAPEAAPAWCRPQTLEEVRGLLQDRAHAQVQATTQAVSQRAGVARQGSKLLRDGGDAAAQALLAKKAAMDAAARDADAVAKVAAAAAACLASAAAARQADAAADVEALQRRADRYALVAADLARPVDPPALSDAEWDALRMVQAREVGQSVVLQVARGAELGLGALQDGTVRGAEALRAWAATPEGGAGLRAGGPRLARSPCA